MIIKQQIMSAWNETYLVSHKKQILNVLNKDAWLVKLGIVDIDKLNKLIQNNQRLAKVAPGLVCCIMTELWLKNLSKVKEGV